MDVHQNSADLFPNSEFVIFCTCSNNFCPLRLGNPWMLLVIWKHPLNPRNFPRSVGKCIPTHKLVILDSYIYSRIIAIEAGVCRGILVKDGSRCVLFGLPLCSKCCTRRVTGDGTVLLTPFARPDSLRKGARDEVVATRRRQAQGTPPRDAPLCLYYLCSKNPHDKILSFCKTQLKMRGFGLNPYEKIIVFGRSILQYLKCMFSLAPIRFEKEDATR